MRPSIATASLLLGLLIAVPREAEAEGVDVRVVRQSLRGVSGSTLVLAGAMGAKVDFGSVSNRGAPPRNGARYLVDGGGAHYVATFELEVVSTGSAFTSTSAHTPSRRPFVEASMDVHKESSQEPSRSGSWHPMPSTGRDLATVDLYASVVGGGIDQGDIRIVTGWFPDWSTSRDVGEPLSAGDVVVAHGLRPGDRIRCEVSLYAPPEAFGHQEATVRFTVR